MKKLKSLSLIIAFVLAVCCLFACTGAVKKYEVKFETYELCEVGTQTVEENKTATRPTDLSSSTHNFVGWYVDEEFSEEFNFSTPITKNTTIYAKWTEKESTYTIKFDNQGKGKKVASQYIEAETNGKITKPTDLSSRGWRFLGWSLDKNDKTNLIDFETYIPSCSITLYAQWNELFTVSFDLNNEEALYPAPNEQEVEDGKTPQSIDQLLPVTGYTFNGWFLQPSGGNAVNPESVTITQDTVFYAQWRDTTNGTIDYDAPYTDNKEEAGFGEKPDVEGFIIDGKMGVDEDWEDQVWYETATLDEYKVTLSITTKFSEKGLYLFAKIKDDNGINFVDRYYSDRNSNLFFYVTAGDNTVYNNALVRSYRIDSDSLYPCDEYVKIAPYVIGQVNSTESAILQIEAFLLWSELQLESMPQSVKINPIYNYKIKGTANNLLNAQMGITLSDKSAKRLDEYAVFDKNGYVKNTAKTEILGDSASGVVMSEGWDTENENTENNAYVSPKTDTTKAIFFNNVMGESYFAKTSINPENFESNGKAGVIIYNGSYDYSIVTVDVNSSVYDTTNKKFTKYKISCLSKVNNVHTLSVIYEKTVDNAIITLDVLYANDCLYVRVNGETVSALFVSGLKMKKTIVGLYSEGCRGVKFTSYQASAYTNAQGKEQTKNYAYLISVGKTRNVEIEVDKEWLSADAENKDITLTLTGSNVAFAFTQRNKIKQNGVVGSGVRMYRIDKLLLNTNGVDNDVTSVLISQSGENGKYVFNYSYDADGVFSNTSVQMQESELVACVFNLVYENGENVSTTAKITTTYPYLNNYTITIQNGDGVLVLPKDYQSKVVISVDGYQDVEFVIDGLNNMTDLGDVSLLEK